MTRHGVRRRLAAALTAAAFVLPLVAPAGVLAQSKEKEKDKGRRIERVGKSDAAKGEGVGGWALVIGVDQYQSKEIERLSGAVADAKAIRDALTKYADFPAGQVMLLTSDAPEKPTAINILEKLEAIKGAAQPGDLLLFFFAGHGVQVEGQRYLLTYDTKIASTAQIKATSLAATTLMQEIEAVKVAHRVVMIDACRNDPTAGGRKPNLANEAFESAFTMLPAGEGGVRATFLSCSRGQSAYEWGEKGRGFFSYYIEQGLSGAASTRGKVTFTSLIDYLNEYVPQAVRENRNRDQIPYTKFEGPPFVLVQGETLSASAGGLDQTGEGAMRTSVRAFIPALLVLFLVAPLAAQKVETIDGVRVVHNEKGGLWGKTPKVGLEFVRKIGDIDTEDEHLAFNYPSDVAVDKDGDVYILDAANSRIQKFGPDGRYLATIGRKGQGPGEFIMPDSLDIDRDGNLVVADSSTSRLHIIIGDGKDARSVVIKDERLYGVRALASGDYAARASTY